MTSLWFPGKKVLIDGKAYRVDITVRIRPIVKDEPLEAFKP